MDKAQLDTALLRMKSSERKCFRNICGDERKKNSSAIFNASNQEILLHQSWRGRFRRITWNSTHGVFQPACEVFFDKYTLECFCNYWSRTMSRKTTEQKIRHHPCVKLFTYDDGHIDIYRAPDNYIHLSANKCKVLNKVLPDICECVNQLAKRKHLFSETFHAICNEVYDIYISSTESLFQEF